MFKKTTVYLIIIYKKYISNILVCLFGNSCRFTPTCSEYARTAIENHGFVGGFYLTIKRIIRCNPFTKISFDPVP